MEGKNSLQELYAGSIEGETRNGRKERYMGSSAAKHHQVARHRIVVVLYVPYCYCATFNKGGPSQANRRQRSCYPRKYRSRQIQLAKTPVFISKALLDVHDERCVKSYTKASRHHPKWRQETTDSTFEQGT